MLINNLLRFSKISRSLSLGTLAVWLECVSGVIQQHKLSLNGTWIISADDQMIQYVYQKVNIDRIYWQADVSVLCLSKWKAGSVRVNGSKHLQWTMLKNPEIVAFCRRGEADEMMDDLWSWGHSEVDGRVGEQTRSSEFHCGFSSVMESCRQLKIKWWH